MLLDGLTTASTTLTSLGADEVIDYTIEDFRARGDRYNVIFELGGKLTLRGCRAALADGGRLVFVGAGSGAGGPIGRFVASSFRAKLLKQPVTAFVSWESTDDLMTLKEMVEARQRYGGKRNRTARAV